MSKRNKNTLAIFDGKKELKSCRHDYKNAIQIGNVDYMCPLCKKILDPFEWFLMNNFEFIDVEGEIVNKK